MENKNTAALKRLISVARKKQTIKYYYGSRYIGRTYPKIIKLPLSDETRKRFTMFNTVYKVENNKLFRNDPTGQQIEIGRIHRDRRPGE